MKITKAEIHPSYEMNGYRYVQLLLCINMIWNSVFHVGFPFLACLHDDDDDDDLERLEWEWERNSSEKKLRPKWNEKEKDEAKKKEKEKKKKKEIEVGIHMWDNLKFVHFHFSISKNIVAFEKSVFYSFINTILWVYEAIVWVVDVRCERASERTRAYTWTSEHPIAMCVCLCVNSRIENPTLSVMLK